MNDKNQWWCEKGKLCAKKRNEKKRFCITFTCHRYSMTYDIDIMTYDIDIWYYGSMIFTLNM